MGIQLLRFILSTHLALDDVFLLGILSLSIAAVYVFIVDFYI